MPSLVPEARDASPLQPTQGRLEFKNVNLEESIINFSEIAEPGTVTAIIGPNGAGKSTLLALAARLIDPESGNILLDGQDLAKHTLASVRSCIGMAGPDLPLIRGSIEKNLLYRSPDASNEEVAHVRKLCDIDELLESLPEGDQTRISEEGEGLSTGQRQRIALARAILGNPPLLLLDEVDANLDTQSAIIIDRVLSQYKGTVLLITHRKERIKRADTIWFLDKGRLVETGQSQKLLNSNGPTAAFCAAMEFQE